MKFTLIQMILIRAGMITENSVIAANHPGLDRFLLEFDLESSI